MQFYNIFVKTRTWEKIIKCDIWASTYATSAKTGENLLYTAMASTLHEFE